jgi:hypothetical protein
MLKCLGKEESYYASIKYTGPNYKLNQIMIDEMSSLNDLEMMSSSYQDICENLSFYPSLRLLEKLLSNGQKIFMTQGSDELAKHNIQALKDKSGRILTRYLALVQSAAPTASCLNDNIPEIKNLYARYRYLEDTLGPKELVGSKKEIKSIFKKLRNIDAIFKKCSEIKRKKD